jgi:hypothetical protein
MSKPKPIIELKQIGIGSILKTHYKDRNPNNNNPQNLRVLTRQEGSGSV